MQSKSTVLLQVEKYDRYGQQQKALALLVKASEAGDVDAMVMLGKRYLGGDKAQFSPKTGVELLIEASNKGSGKAPLLLSVLFGLGLQVEQSWASAFDCLTMAAERGEVEAQSQLRILSADKSLSGIDAAEVAKDSAYWAKLCASVDLSAWNKKPEEVILSESPLVCSYPLFVSKDICKWLIERSRNRLERAKVYDAQAGKDAISNTRTNTAAVFELLDSDLITVLVQTHMSMSCGIGLRHFEAITVLHYNVGEEIKPHFDFVDPLLPTYRQEVEAKGQRIITFLLYLNDDYEGGETGFPRLKVSHKGQAGEGMFFVNALPGGEADDRTVHAGCPILKGEKWIVSQFIRSKPAA